MLASKHYLEVSPAKLLRAKSQRVISSVLVYLGYILFTKLGALSKKY